MLDRGLTVVAEVVEARLRFRMDRPPPLGEGELTEAGLLGLISSFEFLLAYILRS
jgi:hypothetical protein